MDFGLDDFDDLPAVDNSKAPDRLLLDDGEYDLTIKGVSYADGRVEIRLAPDDKAYSWVFAKLPTDADWAKRILSSFRKALGYTREAWAALDGDEELVGRKVRTRVYQKAGRNGGTFVNVGEFIAGAKDDAPAWEKDERKPAARTPAAKVAVAGHGGADDDIPF